MRLVAERLLRLRHSAILSDMASPQNMSVQQGRAVRLQNVLSAQQALLIVNPSDIFYLTGCDFLVPEEREAFFVVTKNGLYFVKASLAPLPISPLPFYRVLNNCRPEGLATHMLGIVQEQGLREILIDKSSLFVTEYEAVLEKLKDTGCALRDLDRQIVWRLRMIKDETEVTSIRRASQVIAEAVTKTRAQLKMGMSEIDVQMVLESETRQLGAEKMAFPTIIAFGANGAEPHYQPSRDTTLQNEMPILIDAGVIIDHYRSDTTRSFWFGEHKSEEFMKVEQAVNGAYKAALEKAKTVGLQTVGDDGVKARDLDQAARSVITEAGYGSNFIHTTGHGVGIDIHEPPSLHSQNEQEILPNMVITIEPGIYIDSHFGFRYENTVLVGEHGAEELTAS